MAGKDIGAAKLHSIPDILHGMTRRAELRNLQCPPLGPQSAEQRQGQMQTIGLQFLGSFAELMQNAGNVMPPADGHDFFRQSLIVGGLHILFAQHDGTRPLGGDFFETLQKVSLTLKEAGWSHR